MKTDIYNCDTVLKNGRIYSVNLDGVESYAEALAIKDGKIAYVGNNSKAHHCIGEKTQVIDLKGKLVLPGLSDSHLHPTLLAENKDNCELHDFQFEYPDKDDLMKAYQDAIAAYVKKYPEKKVVRGMGWNPQSFISDADTMPAAKDIDKVCSDRPVILRSVCGHYVWCNTKALETAGIDKDFETPNKGVIWRDEEGNPTGIFQELTAIDTLFRNVPGYYCTVEEYKETIRDYQKNLANNLGITLIFDALGTENSYKAYKELAEAGELTLRVRGCYYADPSLGSDQFDKFIERKGTDNINDLFECNTVKMFIDGSGQSFYLNQPFTKETIEGYDIKNDDGTYDYDYRGYSQWDLLHYPEEGLTLESIVEKIQKAGFQLHFHSMGDGAITQMLDIFDNLDQDMVRKNRNSFSHLMLVKDGDIERMAKQNAIAAAQPYWFTYDSWVDGYYKILFGPERTDTLYPMKEFFDAGVVVASGSDMPVNPGDPMTGIQLGVTRMITDDMPDYVDKKYHRSLGPDDNPEKECVSVKDMIQSFTINCAYECFLEDVTGSIETGKSADFIILDTDITNIEKTQIKNAKVEKTFFKGNIVYDALA